LDTYECYLPSADNGEPLHYFGKLGSWLTRQRGFKKGVRGVLSAEREKLLQDLCDQGFFQ
jgi:hypothetical protein